MRRLGVRVLIATIVALPIVGLGASASAAPIEILACPGSGTVNLSPGVGLFPAAVTVSGTLTGGTERSAITPCVSLTGVSYTGARVTFQGSGTASCLTVGPLGAVGTGSVSGTADITWYTNGTASATSTATWSVVTLWPLPIVTGTITGGALQGSIGALVPLVLESFTGLCVLTPLTSLTVGGTAAVLQP